MSTLVTTAALENLDARRLARARRPKPAAAAPPSTPPPPTPIQAAALQNLAARRAARGRVASTVRTPGPRAIEQGARGGDTPVAERQALHAAGHSPTSRRPPHPPHVPPAAHLSDTELVALESFVPHLDADAFLRLVFLVETFIGRRIPVAPPSDPPVSVRLIPGPVSEE